MWNLWVEPWCAHWTKVIEDVMMGKGDVAQMTEMNGGLSNGFSKGGNKSNGILPQ